MEIKELIPALTHCTSETGDCRTCPGYTKDPGCLDRLHAKAVEALESQRKRIADLEEAVDFARTINAENIRLKAELEAQNRWVPVTERLPMDEREVLAYYGFDRGDEDLGMMFIGTISYFAFDPKPHFQHESMGLRVTHWMPLPEPPKEGT